MPLPNSNPIIVLEAGATHNGQVTTALDLIDASHPADAIKFQTVWGKNLAPYRQGNITYTDAAGSHSEAIVDLIKRRDMSWSDWNHISAYCANERVTWFTTPDMPATAKRVSQMSLCAIKIAGADMGREDLIRAAAWTNLQILLDTRGGQEELDRALAICAEYRNDTIIVHTPTGYPTDYARLERIADLRAQYPGHIIGFTSHSTGWEDCIAAVRLGAGYIEKGITMDRQQPGIEHLLCIEPHEVAQFVAQIRQAAGEG